MNQTMYVVMLGPPGAGKGTQAKDIAQKIGLAHISSGDIFRENLKSQTELGILAQKYMDQGELVPDDVTIDMIRERLSRPDCANGVVLDGFPRTPAQAKALEEMLSVWNCNVNCVPYISVPDDVLIKRLSGRLACRAHDHIYHKQYNPPKVPGRCDIDGSELYQRDDDKPDTVKNRIRVYMEQTSPLIKYYRQSGLLVEVDGTEPIEKVSKKLVAAILNTK